VTGGSAYLDNDGVSCKDGRCEWIENVMERPVPGHDGAHLGKEVREDIKWLGGAIERVIGRERWESGRCEDMISMQMA